MNSYKLDDKMMDNAFLNGDMVTCRAVLHPREQGILKEGDNIIVMLSTGPKYKGKITKLNFLPVKGYAMGEIEIIKA